MISPVVFVETFLVPWNASKTIAQDPVNTCMTAGGVSEAVQLIVADACRFRRILAVVMLETKTKVAEADRFLTR